MANIHDLVPELTELNRLALVGDVLPDRIEPRHISSAELKSEIERFLSNGRKNSIIRALQEDVPIIGRRLRVFLDDAEAKCGGRSNVADHYSQHLSADRADRYSKAKSRYTGDGNANMEERFALVEAACAALRERGFPIDTGSACASLFDGTKAALIIQEMRDPIGLLDAGKQLSDAWWQIASALDHECDLVGWLNFLKDDVAARQTVPVSRFLGTRFQVDLTRLGIPGAHIAITKDLIVALPPEVEVASYDWLSIPQHVDDLSVAPQVKLFSQKLYPNGKLSGDGRLVDGVTNEPLYPVKFQFWHDILLTLLLTEVGAAPFIITQTRLELCRKHQSVALGYPFTRVFDGDPSQDGQPAFAPVFLANGQPTKLEPRDGWPTDDGICGTNSALRTQYARVHGALPDVLPLFLRYHVDEVDTPLSQNVLAEAQRNASFETAFPSGSIGSVVEKATFVPDRAAGLGALLRRDFLEKIKMFKEAGGTPHFTSAPAQFERSWGV